MIDDSMNTPHIILNRKAVTSFITWSGEAIRQAYEGDDTKLIEELTPFLLEHHALQDRIDRAVKVLARRYASEEVSTWADDEVFASVYKILKGEA